MPHIWGICNGVYIGLIALFPLAAPFVSFYLGFKGTELAYEKSSGTPERFYKKQRGWQYVAVVYLIAVTAIGVEFIFDDLKYYFTKKVEINRLIEKTLDEEKELKKKVEILTSEECLNYYWDGLITEPLLDMEFHERGLWELRNNSGYTYITQYKFKIEKPVILYVEQCFGFEDGRILWLHYDIEDNCRIVEGIYYIVPSEEITSLPLENSLDSRFYLEWGNFMDESDICEVLGISYTPDEANETNGRN